jgi:RNA polymerase sigma factor (sigma-70 family)
MKRALNRFYDQFTDARNSSDRQLLDRFLTVRDEPAFAELVRRYGPVVWGACHRQLTHFQDAEDAFQATFLVLVRRANQLTGDAPIGPWLYKVAVLTARRVARGNQRRAPVTGPMEHEVPAPGSELAVEKLDLDAALLALPERDRVPVVLCHLEGLTRREAAERLGCPEGTLSARLNRALRRLRVRLGDVAPAVLVAGAIAVPVNLAAATVRSATIYSTSTLTAVGVSPVVAGLTDGVLRMFWMQKVVTASVLAALVVGAGVLGWGIAGRSESAGAAETSARDALPALQEEPDALKRLEKRQAELEKQKELLNARLEDVKTEKQKIEDTRAKELAEILMRNQLQVASNHLKQIGLAFHSYGGDNRDAWADDITDKDGRPLLSWRVALLPHLGEMDLYKQFKLDEPWDSAHNKKLIAKMPKVYAPVRVKAKEGETFCQRFVGKGALFNENGSSYTIPQIPDGTSATGLVVEAGDPVIWSKPADLPFNTKGPLPKLGGLFDGDFHILFCDGSVHRFKKDYDVDEMKNVIMPDDGNVIDIKKLQK